MSAELEEVTIVTDYDQDPDMSYLGRFDDQPGPEERTFDRAERGTMRRHEARYFIAAHGPETYEQANGDAEEVMEEVWERAEAYGEGWVMLGIRAQAEVRINGIRQKITSGGLWGVESDAPTDYLREIAIEELHELKGILDAMGVDTPMNLTAEWDSDIVRGDPVAV